MERNDNVHDNSLNARDTLQEGDKREEMIYKLYKRMGRPLTDREVKELLNLPDMNCVRPRITEMTKTRKKDGRPPLLEELPHDEKIKDHVTGKTVRRTRIAGPTGERLFNFEDTAA